jgi:hypothetical protein
LEGYSGYFFRCARSLSDLWVIALWHTLQLQ